MLAVLVAYLGLIPLGHWQDEFGAVRLYNEQGISFFVSRILHWSPRPLSELVIYGYALLVGVAKRPLIGASLAVSWAILAAGLFAIPLKERAPKLVLLALAMSCLFLLAHPVSEMFFWPMAALAYLPVVAAIAFAFWSLLTGNSTTACAVALLVAATCVEVGAMLVFIFCALAVGAKLLTGIRIRWLTLPFLVSVGVLYLLYAGRVTSAQETFGNPAIAHHFGRAAISAIEAFVRELISIDGVGAQRHTTSLGLATKGLFCVAVYGLCRRTTASVESSRWLAVLALACFATAGLTIAAAFYQFGMNCCERHDTLRQCLMYIGLASGAAALALRKGHKVEGAPWALWVLVVAVAIPAWWTSTAIESDYRRYDEMLGIKIDNWREGMSASGTMTYKQSTPGAVVGGIVAPDGIYTQTEGDPWWTKAVVKYFGKQSATFVTREK